MTDAKPRQSKTVPIVIGVTGIVIELIAVTLLAAKRISPTIGTPLIIAGMLLAFVPLFILARRARQR
jgi:hypothetical protein